jgi:hypothetical protein
MVEEKFNLTNKQQKMVLLKLNEFLKDHLTYCRRLPEELHVE